VTPPVALASYTAAGIANASASRTGLLAFVLGMPSYVVPFAFLFTPSILWQGVVLEIALGAASVASGAAAWTIMLAGWLRGNMGVVERAVYGVLSFALILAPYGASMRAGALVVFAALVAWSSLMRPAIAARRSAA